MGEVTDRAELTERVAVLRRFKGLLEQQRGRFLNYLSLLERQETAIGSGSGEEILAHVELERSIVADIFSMQKVINPLEDMYRTIVTPGFVDEEIPALKVSLEGMKTKVQAHSAKNRRLLSDRMGEIRREMDILNDNPFVQKAKLSGYGTTTTASLVDLKG